MRWLLVVLLSLLAIFQYRLWLGEGSFAHKATLQRQVEKQTLENKHLALRNRQLAAEVAGLQDGLEGIEERARRDLGMTGVGETFYLVIEPAKDKKP